MASLKIQDEKLLEGLTEVFRVFGYEGASLSRITKATGLQRASLYHRFPGGKEEMAEAVLTRADNWFVSHILAPLSESGTPSQRIKRMADRLHDFYCGGRKSCLLDSLSLDNKYDALRKHVKSSMAAWMGALIAISEEAGLSKRIAQQRAEDALSRIQGSLVLARATKNRDPFERTLKELPALLTKIGSK